MLGEIALQAGHEIKNPIAAVQLHTELLRKHFGGSEYLDRYIDLVMRNSKKIEEIVDKMKAFGLQDKETKEQLDINDMLENRVLFLLDGYSKKKEIRVEKSFGNIPPFYGNASSIEKAMVNIALNAIEAMDNRGSLFVATSQKNNYIEITMADTGHGIPKENLNKIFFPLFTTRHEGTGLGLSIAYKTIVNQHGGLIDVQSEVGKGTVFTIKLPITS